MKGFPALTEPPQVFSARSQALQEPAFLYSPVFRFVRQLIQSPAHAGEQGFGRSS
jgi:hypothetical protein